MVRAPAELETERLSLRWFTAEDAPLMLAIWNDPEFIHYVGDRGVRTLPQARRVLQESILDRYGPLGYGPYRVAARDNDTPMGICGLFQRDTLDCPDLGFGLLPTFRGLGYANEASRAVLNIAKSDLGLTRVGAIIDHDNGASRRLIIQLGAREMPPPPAPYDSSQTVWYEFSL